MKATDYEFCHEQRPKPKTWDGRKLVATSVFQDKHDGWRLTLYKLGAYVRAFGRQPYDLSYELESVIKPLIQQMPENSVLDCELVPIDPFVHASSIPNLIKERRGLKLEPFSMPLVAGEDLRYKPHVVSEVAAMSHGIKLTPSLAMTDLTRPGDLIALSRARDIEGLVVKEFGWHGWWKVKQVDTYDVVVIDAKPGKGKHAGKIGSLEVAMYIGGKKTSVGHVGKGNDADWRFLKQEEVLGRVCEVSHEGFTAEMKLKFSSFIRWRDDKRESECVLT